MAIGRKESAKARIARLPLTPPPMTALNLHTDAKTVKKTSAVRSRPRVLDIVTMSTPEKFSLLDFEQLSDSIAMTKQMLDATADSVGALDSYNRQMGNYELLPEGNR